MQLDRVIYRESVLIQDRVRIATDGTHFKVVHVAPSRTDPESEIDIWFEASPHGNGMPQPRMFRIYGTGHLISSALEVEHVGTAVTPGGMVWHVYEEMVL